MFDEPALLLERTIYNLEVLRELLKEEVAGSTARDDELYLPIATCLDAQEAIRLALPKLTAASDAWRDQKARQLQMRGRCVNCED